MEFKNFPFSEFEKIETSGSNFTEITTYGEDFPIKGISITGEKSRVQKSKEVYELYRDLAVAKAKQKDTDASLKFRARANYYNIHYLDYKDAWNTFPSRFSLWFARWSNNYRQNWVLPLIWILVFGAIFYAFNLCALDLELLNSNCWKDFPIFLNPTHKFDLIKGGSKYGFLANLIDVISRIFNGFFIYQFIQAFRKYGAN